MLAVQAHLATEVPVPRTGAFQAAVWPPPSGSLARAAGHPDGHPRPSTPPPAGWGPQRAEILHRSLLSPPRTAAARRARRRARLRAARSALGGMWIQAFGRLYRRSMARHAETS